MEPIKIPESISKSNIHVRLEQEAAQQQGKKPVNISDVFALMIRKWYWVALSLILCFACAFLYIKRTQPRYMSTCAIIIRDGASLPSGTDLVDLGGIGFTKTSTELLDEMGVLQSPDMMAEVVKKLGIDICYWEPGVFRSKPLYGSTVPITVSFPDAQDDMGASMKINVTAEGKITVSDLRIRQDKINLDSSRPIAFDTPVHTPYGNIVIRRSPFFKPGKDFDVNVVKYSMPAAVTHYSSEVAIANKVKYSNIVDMTCSDPVLQRANDILNALIEAYNQSLANAKAQVVAATSDFITDRLAVVERELGDVDSNISSFKSDNLIPDIESSSAVEMQRRMSSGDKILQLNNQLQMTRYLREYVLKEGRTQVLPVNTGLENVSLENQISQYNALMLQRNSLAANSSESNPIVQEADGRLASMRSSIMSSIHNQEVSLASSIRNLEREEQSATARVAATPLQAKVLLSAERKQKVQESLYIFLLQKREENELSQTSGQSDMRFVKRPSGSSSPVSPKPMRLYLIAFVIGLALPFGGIYAKEATNNKVRGRKDLEGFSMPIIGEIPKFKTTRTVSVRYFRDKASKGKDRRDVKSELVVKEGNRNMVNEAFRVLRTNVNFVTAGKMPCSVMMTSFNPGSGKTFICANLGMSLAIKKRRVLLVDCDLRRASLSQFVNSPSKGLSDYLSGACNDISAVTVHDALAEGLDVIPVGSIPPNPTELLETERFSSLVRELKKHYDYVLIDCPPIGMLADASIVARDVDRTFFVIRVGLLDRNMLNVLEAMYDEKELPNLGVILNDSVAGSHYGYSYRYGKGYYGAGGDSYDRYYVKE